MEFSHVQDIAGQADLSQSCNLKYDIGEEMDAKVNWDVLRLNYTKSRIPGNH